MHGWNVLHAARWQYRTQKIAKNSPPGYHRKTLSGYISSQLRHVSTVGKKLVKHQCLPHIGLSVVNFGPLTAEIGSIVWGTPRIYLCVPFVGNSPTGQTCRSIFARDSSNDADSRKDVPFVSFVDIAPHLGIKSPNPNFVGVNRRFQGNSRNRKTCILSKLLHRFQPNIAKC